MRDITGKSARFINSLSLLSFLSEGSGSMQDIWLQIYGISDIQLGKNEDIGINFL